jgi:hypothetical protein
MSRRLLVLVLLGSLDMGCGETWGRQSAIEVPLHRDVMGLNSQSTSCQLTDKELEELCNEKNYHERCPKGCSPWIPRGKQ